ncbi:MAG: nucleoside phosphorylase [Bacteroidota bacterium]
MQELIPESELVLNEDGSIYHLHLLPHEIADTIFLVGDQNRVPEVSKHFDKIEVVKHKREFVTHTGLIGNKRFTVISTGIGTDNIDIVLNELDALANVNLQTREVNAEKRSLKFIRIGTSGSLQSDIPVDSVLVSSHGLGLDSLMQFYHYDEDEATESLLGEIDEQLNLIFVNPYLFKSPGKLYDQFSKTMPFGITATCAGFYGPQGRMLRAQTRYNNLIERLNKVNINGTRITNFEMETAGIYGLATLLGHEAVSINAILANRINHTFSHQPHQMVEQTIKKVLEIVA